MIAEINFLALLVEDRIIIGDWNKRYPEMVRGYEVLKYVPET